MFNRNLVAQLWEKLVCPCGIAKVSETVTVDVTVNTTTTGQTVSRYGEYFHSSAEVTRGVLNQIDVDITSYSEEGDIFVPATPEAYSHDADGNLLSDGRWDYTWDGENRLIQLDKNDGDGWHSVASDGLGNVVALVDTDTGSYSSHYEYGPFGESIRATGDMTSKNPFRWGTKYFDQESGFSNYGRRFYDPELGRWLNRDMILELGGLNTYAFVSNSPLVFYDLLGLSPRLPSPERGYWTGDPGDSASCFIRIRSGNSGMEVYVKRIRMGLGLLTMSRTIPCVSTG